LWARKKEKKFVPPKKGTYTGRGRYGTPRGGEKGEGGKPYFTEKG